MWQALLSDQDDQASRLLEENLDLMTQLPGAMTRGDLDDLAKIMNRYVDIRDSLTRRWIDLMENEQYQSLFAIHGADLRQRFLDGAPASVAVDAALAASASLTAAVAFACGLAEPTRTRLGKPVTPALLSAEPVSASEGAPAASA